MRYAPEQTSSIADRRRFEPEVAEFEATQQDPLKLSCDIRQHGRMPWQSRGNLPRHTLP